MMRQRKGLKAVTMLACLLMAGAEIGQAQGEPLVELPKLQEQQTSAQGALDSQFQERRKSVKAWYSTNLDALQKSATERGSLDEVLAVKEERERMDRKLTLAEAASLPAALRPIRQKYDQGLETLATQQKTQELALLRQYIASLSALEKRTTQQGKIEDALKIRQEIKTASSRKTDLETAVSTAAAGLPVNSTPVPAAKVASATPAAPPAKTALPTATRAPSHPLLVGSWHFTWKETGFEADYTFAADGTFKSDSNGKGGGPDGTWKLDGDKIIMDAPEMAPKTIFLPLRASGTKVVDQRKDRLISAVKQKK